MAAASTFIEEGRHRISDEGGPPPQPRGLINDTVANLRARLQNAFSETSCELSQIFACQSARGPDVPAASSSYLISAAARLTCCHVSVPWHLFSHYPLQEKTNVRAVVLLRSRPFVSSVFFHFPPPRAGFSFVFASPPMGSYIIHELHIVFSADAEYMFCLLCYL